jgi:hypothetical protein
VLTRRIGEEKLIAGNIRVTVAFVRPSRKEKSDVWAVALAAIRQEREPGVQR